MRELVKWTDFILICTGASRRQNCAISDGIETELKKIGDEKQGISGWEEGSWIAVDFGDVITHVFSPEKREYYQLDQLWADAGRVEWSPAPVPADTGAA